MNVASALTAGGIALAVLVGAPAPTGVVSAESPAPVATEAAPAPSASPTVAAPAPVRQESSTVNNSAVAVANSTVIVRMAPVQEKPVSTPKPTPTPTPTPEWRTEESRKDVLLPASPDPYPFEFQVDFGSSCPAGTAPAKVRNASFWDAGYGSAAGWASIVATMDPGGFVSGTATNPGEHSWEDGPLGTAVFTGYVWEHTYPAIVVVQYEVFC